MVQIRDETGKLSLEDLAELRNFVINHLILSNKENRDWLIYIKIRRDGIGSGYLGFWTADFRRDSNNPTLITGIKAKIVLNYSFLKTLNELKKTLAHEYGHHWTLSYLAINQNIDIWQERLPSDYYILRGLEASQYAHDYSMDWCYCDKEILAEDYRYFFAPPPYNNNHEITIRTPLALPSHEVGDYIKNLQFIPY